MNANKKLTAIKEIISAKNGLSDSQEFGLTYCQAVDFLDKIEEILKPKHAVNWFNIIADRLPDHLPVLSADRHQVLPSFSPTAS